LIKLLIALHVGLWWWTNGSCTFSEESSVFIRSFYGNLHSSPHFCLPCI